MGVYRGKERGRGPSVHTLQRDYTCFFQRWFHVLHSCMTKHYHVGLIEFTREALHMSMNMHVFFILYTREILLYLDDDDVASNIC